MKALFERMTVLKKKTEVSWIISTFLIASVLLSVVSLLYGPTVLKIGDVEIYSFLGEVLSSTIGVFATLLVFDYTVKQNREDNATTRAQLDYQMRLPILPVIGINKVSDYADFQLRTYLSKDGFIDEDSKNNHLICISFSNIGSGSATDIELNTNNGRKEHLNSMAVGSNKVIGVHLPPLSQESNEIFCVNIEVFFHDVQYRTYSQPFSIKLENNNYKVECKTYPRLLTEPNIRP